MRFNLFKVRARCVNASWPVAFSRAGRTKKPSGLGWVNLFSLLNAKQGLEMNPM
jgi:hypothetical protein